MSNATKRNLPNVPAQVAVQSAYAAVSAVQHLRPEEQAAGVFLLAYVMAQQLGLDVSEVFNQSQRRFDFANTVFKREAQALSDYINGEMR